MSVVVVGSLNVDLHLRLARLIRPGETLLASGGTFSPGGKGANQACAAALSGAETTMLGALGDDDMAETAVRLLRQAGVDLARVHRVRAVPTGLAVVSVDREGENTVVVVPGANAEVSPAMVDDWAEAISDADVLVLQGEIPAASSVAAAGYARGRVIVNLAPVIDLPGVLLRRADPLVVNEHEGAAALVQLGGAPLDDPVDIVAALLTNGVTSVVLTLGASGALVGRGGEVERVASPKVTAVDTVGAGDAFVGALAARLSRGDDLVTASRQAARFAAHTVQFEGAQTSYPAPGTELVEET